MQISSNHTGINFSSVYKSVVTRHHPAPEDSRISQPAVSIQSSDEADVEKARREEQLLRVAQRAADRTAGMFASAPEL